MRPTAWAAALLLAAPTGSAAQIGSAVAGVVDGTVRLGYPTREGVEICEQGVRLGSRRLQWRSRGWDDEGTSCRVGSVEVELALRAGEVQAVRVLLREADRTPGAVDLGTVGPDEAEAYLVGLARGGATAKGADGALVGAVLADVDEAWRDLAGVARDREVPTRTRKTALFWLGQEAADAVTGDLADVARAPDEDQEVRDAAIFALAQRPRDEGLPVLMELARTGDGTRTRRSAMFWLAESGDERVVPFFEEILLGHPPG